MTPTEHKRGTSTGQILTSGLEVSLKNRDNHAERGTSLTLLTFFLTPYVCVYVCAQYARAHVWRRLPKRLVRLVRLVETRLSRRFLRVTSPNRGRQGSPEVIQP